MTSFLSFQERTLLHFSCWQQTLCRCFLVCVSPRKAKFSPSLVVDTGFAAVSSPSRPDTQSSGGHPLCIPSLLAPLGSLQKMPCLSSHAILLLHFGFSHLILSGCSPFLRMKAFLFLFCSFPFYYISFPFPPFTTDLESSWTVQFESLPSASHWLMDKATETLASSSLPLATQCILTLFKVKVLCWNRLSAPFKSRAPPTTTCFTSLLNDPAPSPLPLSSAPHIPWHPPSCPLDPPRPPPPSSVPASCKEA